jgi:FHA domain-containing protein
MFELTVESGPTIGQRFVVQNRTTLGRIKGNDIVLPDASVSRQHARCLVQGQRLLVRDLGSANGTFVNNRKIDQAEIAPGDVLRVGKVELRVRAVSAASPAAPTRPPEETGSPRPAPSAPAPSAPAPSVPAPFAEPPSADRIRTRTPAAGSAGAATAAEQAGIRQRRKTLQYSPYAHGPKERGLLSSELEQRSTLFKLGVAAALIAVALAVILFSVKLTDWLVPGPQVPAAEDDYEDSPDAPPRQ